MTTADERIAAGKAVYDALNRTQESWDDLGVMEAARYIGAGSAAINSYLRSEFESIEKYRATGPHDPAPLASLEDVTARFPVGTRVRVHTDATWPTGSAVPWAGEEASVTSAYTDPNYRIHGNLIFVGLTCGPVLPQHLTILDTEED